MAGGGGAGSDGIPLTAAGEIALAGGDVVGVRLSPSAAVVVVVIVVRTVEAVKVTLVRRDDVTAADEEEEEEEVDVMTGGAGISGSMLPLRRRLCSLPSISRSPVNPPLLCSFSAAPFSPISRSLLAPQTHTNKHRLRGKERTDKGLKGGKGA